MLAEKLPLLPPLPVLEQILTLAGTAPSAENNQPWDIAVSNSKILVNYRKDRILHSDSRHLCNYLALGAFTENLRLAALEEGYEAETFFLPNPKSPYTVFEISFSKTSPRVSPLSPFLEKRYTERGPLSLLDLPPELKKELNEIVAGSEVSFGLVEGEKKERTAEVLSAMDGIRLFYRSLHQEVFGSLRFSQRNYQNTRDGIPVQSLRLSFLDRFAFTFCRSLLFCKIANFVGLEKALQKGSFKNIRRSGAIGYLAIRPSSAHDEKRKCLLAGQIFERLWLSCTKSGFGFQPLAAYPILSFLAQTPESPFSSQHKELLSKTRNRLEQEIPALKACTPLIFFRIGQAPLSKAWPSLRYNLSL